MSHYDIERDLRIVEAMAAQVGRYLIENQLFWPIAGSVRGGMPHLTIGGLLLRLYRLNTLRSMLDSFEQAKLDEAQAALDKARAEWSVNYDRKITQEWDTRIGLMKDFLRDCEDQARGCIDDWPSRAEQRTILHHLQEQAESRRVLTDAKRTELAGIDRGLRRFLLQGENGAFLWADELMSAYPRETYWWLWVAPPTEEDLEDGTP